MRAVAFGIALALLTGCVAGDRYAPTRTKLGTLSIDEAGRQAAFQSDVRACGGRTDPYLYVVPLVALPLFLGAELAIRENTRRCMEARGWRLLEPASAPLPSHSDGGLDGRAGDSR